MHRSHRRRHLLHYRFQVGAFQELRHRPRRHPRRLPWCLRRLLCRRRPHWLVLFKIPSERHFPPIPHERTGIGRVGHWPTRGIFRSNRPSRRRFGFQIERASMSTRWRWRRVPLIRSVDFVSRRTRRFHQKSPVVLRPSFQEPMRRFSDCIGIYDWRDGQESPPHGRSSAIGSSAWPSSPNSPAKITKLDCRPFLVLQLSQSFIILRQVTVCCGWIGIGPS